MSKRKKRSTKGRTLAGKHLRTEILKLFRKEPKKRLNAKQIIKKLKINNSSASVGHALSKLTKDEQLTALEGYKFQVNKAKFQDYGNSNRRSRRNKGDRETHEGYVDMTRTGAAYITIDDQDQDVHISGKYMNGALHGDRVQITSWIPRGRKKPEGEVLQVLERANEHFIGTLQLSKKFGFVVPMSERIPIDIYVKLKDLNGAKNGEVVVVRVTEWPTKDRQSPKGIITTVLGEAGGSDMAMKTILINNGFELDFPEAVLAQAEGLPTTLSETEIAKRRDMRKVPTFTIDPADAKDFDDALSLEYLDNGNYEIGVHIADVTHYVKANTKLDKEAYNRSTSVYLVDRVLPMLPEKLSNGVCSLRPNEDKYTFSVVFTFDKNDKMVDYWIGKTATHSDRRFAYEEAQEVLDTGKGDFVTELKKMEQVAQKLRKERFKKGSINFETDEVKFRLDENAVPVEAYIKERIETNLLIEDFMLLANKTVAKFINKKMENKAEIPFIYRVHDSPDPEKVAEFALFAKELGVQLDVSTPDKIAEAYNKLSKLAEEDETFKMLQPLAIRTMAKAEYTVDNIGHYGLGFDFYSHFTSPIRRYSDVLAHRILFSNLQRTYRVDKAKLEARCKHISMQERKAMDAERASIKYKQVEFIKKHVGEEFTGIVSGMMDRGLFVELKGSKCEGMVDFSSLPEHFRLENGRLRAVGISTGTVYKVGQEVQVLIVSADLDKRQIDMKLLDY